MGILVMLAIACVLFGVLYWIGFDLDWEWATPTGFICSICTGVFAIFMAGYVGCSYFGQAIDLQGYQNQSAKISRMLQEDYNPGNLSAAIDFNNSQKMIRTENSTFYKKYWTSFVSVDTIAIPSGKFMPTQKLILDRSSPDSVIIHK